MGVVNIADIDPIPDVTAEFDIWNMLSLNVYSGGAAESADWQTNPIAEGGTVEMGEHIKLKIDSDSGTSTNFKFTLYLKHYKNYNTVV